MDNLADLKEGIDQMRFVASLLTRWADDREKSLAEKAPEAELETVRAEDAAPVAVPAAPAFTLPEVRTILTEKCAAGFSAQVKALIESYGVSSLREVPAEKYGELVDMVRGLGEAGEADAG